MNPLDKRDFHEIRARDVIRWTIPWIALPAVALAVLLVGDMLLYLLGKLGFVLSTSVWGTYAAWAGAILPSFALIATVGMWISDKRLADVRSVWGEANRILIMKGPGPGVKLLNGSALPVFVLAKNAINGDETAGDYLEHNGEKYLGLSVDFEFVDVAVNGEVFRFHLYRLPTWQRSTISANQRRR